MPKNPLNFNQSINFQTLHLLRKIHRRRQRDPLLISEEIKSRWCHKWKNSKKSMAKRRRKKNEQPNQRRFKCKFQHKSFFFPLFYNIRIHIVVDSFHFFFQHHHSDMSLLTSWSYVRRKKKRCSCMRKRKATASTMAEKKSLTCIGDGSEQASKQAKEMKITDHDFKTEIESFSLFASSCRQSTKTFTASVCTRLQGTARPDETKRQADNNEN